MLLACGASPVMADDPTDAVQITDICDGLNINIGTLNQSTISAMLAAGKRAAELGHPIVLDPVGAGASALRTDTALRLMEEVPFTVIRGNISEIETLAVGRGSTRGVDANSADEISEGRLDAAVMFARGLAERTGAVIVITGPIDIAADSGRAFCIRNGDPMMSAVTGTGCQLSAVIAAFVTANSDTPLEAAAAAACAMGLCGEIAWERLTELDGNASYRNYMIDAMYRLTPQRLNEGARYEVR